jgi:microcystin-dependent protein
MSKLYPIGMVLPYSGAITSEVENNLINAGYMPCDGRTLSKTNPQYVELFNQIKTFYGGDDENFCVPDYRGRFMRGTDYGAGRDKDAGTRTAPTALKFPGNSGDNVGSLEAGGILAHTHSYAANGGDYWHNNYGGLQSPGVYTENDTTGGTSSSSGGAETRPKNVYINYVIVFI